MGGAGAQPGAFGTWMDQNGTVHYGPPPTGWVSTGQTGTNSIGGNLPIYTNTQYATSSMQGTPGEYNSASNYIPLNPSGSAQDMASRLLAAESQDWQQTYKPIELNLLNQDSLNNPQVLTNAVNKATDSTNHIYDNMAGVEQRKLSSLGIAPTAEQQADSTRVRSLSRAAAVAGARNQARQNVETQDELIALGTAPNPNVVQQSVNAKYANTGG